MGKNGLTAGVAMALDEALTAHEIVKARTCTRPLRSSLLAAPCTLALTCSPAVAPPQVRVGDSSEDEADDVATSLAGQLRASVAGRVGGTVLFVRLRKDGAPSVLRPMLDALA